MAGDGISEREAANVESLSHAYLLGLPWVGRGVDLRFPMTTAELRRALSVLGVDLTPAGIVHLAEGASRPPLLVADGSGVEARWLASHFILILSRVGYGVPIRS